MSPPKRLGLSHLQADLLTMKLQEEELLGAVRQALSVRKLRLRLDYTTHVPQLMIVLPEGDPIPWQAMNTQKRRLFKYATDHVDASAFITDLTDRLAKLGARMALVHHKDQKTQRKLVKMVVISEDSRLINLSLVGVYKGGACLYDGFNAKEMK